MTKEPHESMATCWSLIAAVHGGDQAARSDFVERYMSPVLAYLRVRWGAGPLSSELDDAAQEVFIRCFSEAGPLGRLTKISGVGFRSFLYGVTRNVAREIERDRSRQPAPAGERAEDIHAREERLSTVFDRQFARQVMREARTRFQAKVEAGDPACKAGIELLRLRFDEGLPIRKIAEQLGQDPAQVHKEYARARRDYRLSLTEIVAEQNPNCSAEEVSQLLADLVQLLS